MLAAPRATRLRRLVLFEGWPAREPERHGLPESLRPEMDRLLAEDDAEGMLLAFLRGVLHLEEATIDAMRSQPSWPGRIEGARRVVRELDGYSLRELDPAMGGAIRVPTLLIVGAATTDPALADVDAVAASIPGARVAIMPDEGHIADVLAPEVYASHLIPFLLE
jgi:pimeloyl-ACP methyl ester carboxylesterase